MAGRKDLPEGDKSKTTARGPRMSRRAFIGLGAFAGLGALVLPAQRAEAWSSWTNVTSALLKNIGMGDCMHEDIVQIAYARVVRTMDRAKPSLLNPWAGVLSADNTSATIAGDTVERGTSRSGAKLPFADPEDLAARLYRENLAYLRIGSFWNDAAANTLVDFGASCAFANSVPKFSGKDYYTGAWDVGQHLRETAKAYPKYDSIVQFTMNDRSGFIHGMLTSTASHSGHLKMSDVKKFALQWLSVAYEYARTGEVATTSDVPEKANAQKIFDGLIDCYEQLDESLHDMVVSLKVGSKEASRPITHRRLRLRALGMMCHTLEDFWCPSHTIRVYEGSGSIPDNAVLAFSNYKVQNGKKPPMFGYHIPFDRYAITDSTNSTNYREAFTRGIKDTYPGTEQLANVMGGQMDDLASAHTVFKTLGMNQSIESVTKLFTYLVNDTAWDAGVRAWFDSEILPTYFDADGQSYVCDAGRRSMHTPSFVIAPIKAIKRAFSKTGISDAYNGALEAASLFDDWQRGAHKFFSGAYNREGVTKVPAGYEGESIWSEAEGEKRIVSLVDSLYGGIQKLGVTNQEGAFLDRAGCNGCHGMQAAIDKIRGVYQEFGIVNNGSLHADTDSVMHKLATLDAFFERGAKGSLSSQSDAALFAMDDDETYQTADMAIESVADGEEEGSYVIGVRDMDSLETSVMTVPAETPGVELLQDGRSNLTITYALDAEFEDDVDYSYVVTNIESLGNASGNELHFVTGKVKQVTSDAVVLGLAGSVEYKLILDGTVAAVPQVGDYVCAWYTGDGTASVYSGFEEVDEPGELKTATYEVDSVYGSSLTLYTGSEETDTEAGYRSFMQVEYGNADMSVVPQEGQEVTVYYYDDAYGDVTDMDEQSLMAHAAGASFPTITEQDDEDDDGMNDSADTPGYIEHDDYGKLDYGNEVFHVATAIGTPVGNAVVTPDTTSSDASTGSAATTTTPKTGTTTSDNETLPGTGDPSVALNAVIDIAAAAGATAVAYGTTHNDD